MKFADINKRYTEIVTEYIAQGYTINTTTMSGSQGEAAKIDLTNGTEIIRILIHSFNDWRENTEGFEILVGRSTDKVAPNGSDTMATVWSVHLNVISTERFYKIGEDRKNGTYYGTFEEAKVSADLRYRRYEARQIYRKSYSPTGKAMEIAKTVIRNKLGFKRIVESDVKISKYEGKYVVSYRGKTYKLR